MSAAAATAPKPCKLPSPSHSHHCSHPCNHSNHSNHSSSSSSLASTPPQPSPPLHRSVEKASVACPCGCLSGNLYCGTRTLRRRPEEPRKLKQSPHTSPSKYGWRSSRIVLRRSWRSSVGSIPASKDSSTMKRFGQRVGEIHSRTIRNLSMATPRTTCGIC